MAATTWRGAVLPVNTVAGSANPASLHPAFNVFQQAQGMVLHGPAAPTRSSSWRRKHQRPPSKLHSRRKQQLRTSPAATILKRQTRSSIEAWRALGPPCIQQATSPVTAEKEIPVQQEPSLKRRSGAAATMSGKQFTFKGEECHGWRNGSREVSF
ncbi:hypothetical protein LR48_Vigan07g120400 [Vigna angularis]|uniref:Uncharacterized protein n=1 Tax=Phaseolus angularis TaxID=3914 RepID=A0A0L9UXD5_PHAAN|nr:hypothetical protein LR48_Vigan07g120400 [Vigna angularis]